MPRNKDLKRLVRARMRKTGEAYTAARAHVVKPPKLRLVPHPVAASAARGAPAAVSVPMDYAAAAGMSDEKLKAKTGCTWQRWVRALDHHGAGEMSHRDIARLVTTKYKIGPWWSQMVTVGYERIKGLRARGQRRDGTFRLSKSRTYDVPVTTLFDAWADPSVRRRWLNAESATMRTAIAPRSMRLGWADRSSTAVQFRARGNSKSTVEVEHTKLPDRETADRLKQYWATRLDALAEVLAERGAAHRGASRAAARE